MAGITVNKSITGLASAFSGSATLTDTEGIVASPTVPMAQPGQLTIRGGNTAGTVTMTNSGHGIITGQRVDIYWTGGACYGATVGTVSGTAVPIASVSGGDVLPALNALVVIGIATKATINIVGNNLTCLACGGAGAARSYFVFQEVDASTDDFAAKVLAGDVFIWYVGCNYINPLATKTTVSAWISHDNISAPMVLSVEVATH